MLPLVEPLSPCPVCASETPHPLHVMRNMRPIVQVPFLVLAGCPSCGFVYTSPRPSELELSQFYDPESDDGWDRGHNLDDPEQWARFERSQELKREKGRRLMAAVAESVTLPGRADRRAFDFGCGAGAFLDVLQDSGWATSGLEPHRLRDVAGTRHRMLDAVPVAETFDLVMVHHVLEHVLWPGKVLASLARATRPGGILLCSMPDLEGLPRHRAFTYVASAVHINSFTTASVGNLLQQSGWAPVRVESGGFLPDQGGKDAERMMALAVRDDSAGDRPLDAGALAVAVHALRAYGRLLGVDGKARKD